MDGFSPTLARPRPPNPIRGGPLARARNLAIGHRKAIGFQTGNARLARPAALADRVNHRSRARFPPFPRLGKRSTTARANSLTSWESSALQTGAALHSASHFCAGRDASFDIFRFSPSRGPGANWCEVDVAAGSPWVLDTYQMDTAVATNVPSRVGRGSSPSISCFTHVALSS